MKPKHFRSMVACVAVVVFACGFGACATGGTKTVGVTGEALKVVATEFVAVSDAFKKGCDGEPRTIAPAQCAAFKEFSPKFKQVYPLAVNAWEAGRRTNDAAAQGKAADIVRSLSVDLSTLALQAFGTFGAK